MNNSNRLNMQNRFACSTTQVGERRNAARTRIGFLPEAEIE
jgi:hypothetical protein